MGRQDEQIYRMRMPRNGVSSVMPLESGGADPVSLFLPWTGPIGLNRTNRYWDRATENRSADMLVRLCACRDLADKNVRGPA